MVHNWLGGLFPKKAQDELWGQTRHFHLRLLRTNRQGDGSRGRYLLSGRFPFSSGSSGAAWNLCGAMLPIGPEGRPVPAFTLVPKADYKLDRESWRPVGLGGTGSFDVIVENAFVPDYRVLRFSDAVGCTAPGAELNKNPLYRISLLTGVAFALAMPAVGAASGSLERFIDENKVRQTYGAGDRPDLQCRRRPLPATWPSTAARLARRGRDQPPYQSQLRRRYVDVRSVRLRAAARRTILNAPPTLLARADELIE